MKLHQGIINACLIDYTSDQDIFKSLVLDGFKGSATTASRERRVLTERGKLRSKWYNNEHNNGQHKRFIKGVK
jgi:hypothetical protein